MDGKSINKKIAFNDENMGEVTKKAMQELINDGEVEKKEDGYYWTEKGILEVQKSLFKFHTIWTSAFEKK